MTAPYQLFPNLTIDELEALTNDISSRRSSATVGAANVGEALRALIGHRRQFEGALLRTAERLQEQRRVEVPRRQRRVRQRHRPVLARRYQLR